MSKKLKSLNGLSVIKEIELRYKTKDNISDELLNIDSPSKVHLFLKEKIGNAVQENFCLFFLNNKNKMIGWKIATIGTISEAIIHPREVFQPAIYIGASSIIISHNHPTGELSPSKEDIMTTKRLSEAGQIIGIPILDHVIITDNAYFSFKEGGYI